MKLVLERLVHMCITRKMSLSCQIICQLKIQPFWKVFGLQEIESLITCEVLFLPLVMFILKTLLSLHIVVLKTCNLH